ncbi:MAG: peptidylprolyl isomerase [Gemmatimonadetes bacterium]|nr:peptidylprolyl isomerase [Gemmatimonadota bacterium]
MVKTLAARGQGAWLVGAALLWAAGCGDVARRGIVARADDWTLTEDRLAELLVLAQPYPLDSAAVHQLATYWLGGAALSLRAAAGDSLDGPEAVAASTWLARREAVLSEDRLERLGDAVTLEWADVGSTFREGSIRLIAHVLRRVGPETSSSERLLQQRTAERLLSTLVEGGSWDQIVAESQDDESRQAGGLLGLFGRGELPSTLDRTAFSLEPGQVSGVIQSSLGYHILYRPRFEEVSSLFGSRLRDRRLAEADLAAGERDRAARGFAVTPSAEVVVGTVAANLAEWLDSEQPLATWDGASGPGGEGGSPSAGGSLTAGTAARYLVFLPEQSRSDLADAAPQDRTGFITDLGTREMRVADWAERGRALDPTIEESFVLAHADEIEFWTQILELDGPEAPSRSALARHMELVVSRRAEARSLPPLLEALLLGRTDTRVQGRSVLAAIVRARTLLREAGGGGDPGA